MSQADGFDFDVLVVGSGFGGAVAALRFAEAGLRVCVVERGDWVRRDTFQADPDMFWIPERHRFGMNELRPRGRTVVPWLGSAVGGGSHVYAATLKRRDGFYDFPAPFASEDLTPWYERAEAMMDAMLYPSWPPYSEIQALRLLYEAEARVAAAHPDRVESMGPILLGISFAPADGTPGQRFLNRHGAPQRYADPGEQKILGGDIETKNTLDLNYLFRAEALGARIEARTEVDRIEPLRGGGYRVHARRWVPDTSGWARFRRRWLPGGGRGPGSAVQWSAPRVVLAAGSIGSTEILLRNRDVHGTLPDLSPTLGTRYSSNGDYVNLMIPFRGLFVTWGGFVLAVLAFLAGWGWTWIGVGAALYFAGLVSSRPPVDPDLGTTNSDYIRFRHRDGSPQGSYIEGGRYPTPDRALIAVIMSGLGVWKPSRYRFAVRITRALRWILPPFEALARSWPVPLLQMGRDDAVGTCRLNDEGRLEIDFPLDDNADYYRDLDHLARLVARAANAWFVPNVVARWTRTIEVPHNLGGAPMGASAVDGVVDHAGRVFDYPGLMVLDGAVIPVALGPNPALTILAIAERALDHVLRDEGLDRTAGAAHETRAGRPR